MVSSEEEQTLTLKARCHCGLAQCTVTLPKTSLPLKSAICSCTTCRRISGQLFGTFVFVSHAPLPDISQLTSYASSPELTRVFCSRCGCSVLNNESSGWEFTGGILDIPIDGLLDRQALFADDSGDGGGYIWLPKKNGAGREIKILGGGRGSNVVDAQAMRRAFDAKQPSGSDSAHSSANERLYASCHCGAFQCYVTRPSPDVPGPTPGRGKWWLAEDGRRYSAILDACSDCRKVTGFEINFWAYIPADNFFTPDGSALDPAKHPALKHYDSSPGIRRDFCGTCGASVFFRKFSRDPSVWDFAVGLFESKGARAEDWLEWDGIEYEGSALDPSFVKGIAEAMKTEKS